MTDSVVDVGFDGVGLIKKGTLPRLNFFLASHIHIMGDDVAVIVI